MKYVSKIMVIIGLLLVGSAFFNSVKEKQEEDTATQVYRDLQKRAVVGSNEPIKTEFWWDKVGIDLDSVKMENPDVIGWLWFEDGSISYPILYSGDDEKYLHTDYKGNESVAGSIFMEGKNDPYFADKHTLLYGHNMKNLSMFGRLKKYKEDPEFWEDHQFFQVVTSGAVFQYKIIACKEVSPNDEIYRVVHENESAEFADFITKNILVGNYINSDYVYSTKDEFVTLSTCSSFGNRFTVTAVKYAAHYV